MGKEAIPNNSSLKSQIEEKEKIAPEAIDQAIDHINPIGLPVVHDRQKSVPFDENEKIDLQLHPSLFKNKDLRVNLDQILDAQRTESQDVRKYLFNSETASSRSVASPFAQNSPIVGSNNHNNHNVV